MRFFTFFFRSESITDAAAVTKSKWLCSLDSASRSRRLPAIHTCCTQHARVLSYKLYHTSTGSRVGNRRKKIHSYTGKWLNYKYFFLKRKKRGHSARRTTDRRLDPITIIIVGRRYKPSTNYRFNNEIFAPKNTTYDYLKSSNFKIYVSNNFFFF